MTGSGSKPLITYSQNREDLYLWALVGHRTPGFYVDVGCNHERLHSVTRLFYERGWSGVDIDANPKMAVEYRSRTRDTFVIAGVGETDGELVFRDYPGHDGLSTFDDVVKDLHAANGYPHVDRVVPVRPLASILRDLDVSAIDFLKIDVEGLEAVVLRGVDFEATRPAVIVVEASRADACDAVLLPKRYRVEFFDGLNTYYVDDDLLDITIHSFADRVLQPGFRTPDEERLRRLLAPARRARAVWQVRIRPRLRFPASDRTHQAD